MVLLETARLRLRELTQADFGDLAQMLQDKDVMTAYGHDFSADEVQGWLNRQLHRYRRDGFGLWAAVLKSSGEMLGQAGLTLQPCENKQVLEIGYLLKKQFWHQGYAREAAAACKSYAFQVLDRNAVHAIIKADNFASMRVARAIGMEKEKEFVTRYYGGDMLHFLFTAYR